MRRNRIVNNRLHPFFFQIFLQCIAAAAANGENMKNIRCVVRVFGENDRRIFDPIDILLRNFNAALIIRIKIFEFYIKNCGIDLTDPAIPALILENIFTAGTIIGKRADCVRYKFIIGRNRTGIAERAQVFPGIKTVRTVSETACPLPMIHTPMCLRIVFYEL